MRLYRFDLIQSFLTAGIPLSKIDCLRSFLEKYGHRLTSQSHLRELIPSVLQKEKETLKSELSEAKAVSTIFYGSTRLGEALANIVRFVDSQWNVQQRLVRLQVLAKSLKAEELAQCLIQALAAEYAIQPGALLAAMKERASVNQAALHQVRFFFPQLLNVTCFSHTIDNVGKHFEFRVLDTFAQYWVSLFSHSAAARLAWKARTGTAMRTYSPTRWWSKWEVMNLVLEYFADVEPFVRENDHLAPATRAQLMEIFNSPADSKVLELELAAFVDGGNHFVATIYYLEGDGPLVFSCYERLPTVSNAVAVAAYPNVEGVARRQAVGNLPVTISWWPKPKHVSIRGCIFFRESLAKSFKRTFVPSVVPDCVVQYKSSNFAPQQLPWRS